MRLHKNIASFWGVGFFPIAPGTAGAFIGALIFYMIHWVFNYLDISYIYTNIALILLTLGVMLIGNISINKLKAEWEHDASQIVIDEVIGIWITLLFIPFNLIYFLLGFVLFRFFDIAKPLGIRMIDKLNSSWSIMLDDIIAGIYSSLCLQIIIYFIH